MSFASKEKSSFTGLDLLAPFQLILVSIAALLFIDSRLLLIPMKALQVDKVFETAK
jgi:hypothetical protein